MQQAAANTADLLQKCCVRTHECHTMRLLWCRPSPTYSGSTTLLYRVLLAHVLSKFKNPLHNMGVHDTLHFPSMLKTFQWIYLFPHRNEFKAYRDVKPTKMIRAKSQYLPPDDKTNLETSYSATFKGTPPQPADNKAQERRRIRSLYSEPYIEPSKQVRITKLALVIFSMLILISFCTIHCS